MSTNPLLTPEAPLVLSERAGGAVRLTLNRGDRFNALSSAMIDALQREVDALAADREARVVILAAAGRGFCAGHDLKEMRAHASDAAWQSRLFEDCNRLMVSLTRLPQPVIARVHGIATAAGCQLVSMCDLAVASDAATFALPGVNIGVFCTTPAVGVARNVARKRVMEMLLTGDPIDAQRALEWGLVNRVVPADRLVEETESLAKKIAEKPPATVAAGKRGFYQQMEANLAQAYQLASGVISSSFAHAEGKAGMEAFIDKKPPPKH